MKWADDSGNIPARLSTDQQQMVCCGAIKLCGGGGSGVRRSSRRHAGRRRVKSKRKIEQEGLHLAEECCGLRAGVWFSVWSGIDAAS